MLIPLARDRCVAACHNQARLAASARTAAFAHHGALRYAQPSLRPPGSPEAGNEAAVRQGGESRNPDIDTNHTVALSRCISNHRYCERYGPPLCISLERATLD